MALDHALAACGTDGQAVLRLYEWERPTVSFGRNEPSAGLYSQPEADVRGVDYVRRPTGGRAVLHDRELTYAVVAPLRALGRVRDVYTRINVALAAAVGSLGAEVGISGEEGTMTLHSGPCFQSPVKGEVVAKGRKLVGSAQARVHGMLLQHGSIILSGDQSLLDDLRGSPDGHQAPATLEDLVGPVSSEDLGIVVMANMQSAFGGSWEGGVYDPHELKEADRLESEQYTQDSWTWRR